jgi:acetolactate synthase-1/2/3 large subunit
MSATDQEPPAGPARWQALPAGDAGDAIVAGLAAGGVAYVFFTSGSEIGFYQEAVAKARAEGRPAPRLIVMTHEHASLNAALGYAAVSGRPAATAAHVDAGTLHHGGALHNALHSGLPVLMTAGYPPTSAAGTSLAGRNAGGHLWLQENYDQHAIVRSYVKWDHRMTAHDDPGLTVSRALQVATSEPCGPVYLSVSPEVSMRPMAAQRFATLAGLGRTTPAAPDGEGLDEIARRLLSARNPRLVVSGSGRDPRTVPALVTLCERLGLPVVHSATRCYLSFPMDHPLMVSDGDLSDADVVVVLEADVPWMPGPKAPGEDAWIAVLGWDPIKTKIPTYEFTADLRLAGDPLQAILGLDAALAQRMAPADLARGSERLQAFARVSERVQAALAAELLACAGGDMIHPLQLSQEIARIVDDDTIVFDDTLPHNRVHAFLRCRAPGSYFFTPGTSGGWAPGAAFGAKLAAGERQVIAVTGDGFYMFSTANAALWAGKHYGAPFLTVVYQNRSWGTATVRMRKLYPDGHADKAGFDGGYFDPPIDFAMEAQATGAYGENVRHLADLGPALRRGLAQVRAGCPAVIAVWLPRHLHND